MTPPQHHNRQKWLTISALQLKTLIGTDAAANVEETRCILQELLYRVCQSLSTNRSRTAVKKVKETYNSVLDIWQWMKIHLQYVIKLV
jgi:hypothetical protein